MTSHLLGRREVAGYKHHSYFSQEIPLPNFHCNLFKELFFLLSWILKLLQVINMADNKNIAVLDVSLLLFLGFVTPQWMHSSSGN